MSLPFTLSDDEVKWAAQKRKEGWKYQQIGEQLFVHPQTVMRMLKIKGLFEYAPSRKGQIIALSDDQIMWAAQKRKEGWTYPKIADELYVEIKTVTRSLKRRGLFEYVVKET